MVTGKMIWNWFSVLIVLSGIIYLIFFKPSLRDSICKRYEDLKDLQIHHVVNDAYVDEEQHLYHIVELNSSNGMSLNLSGDRSGLFETVLRGDSLVKEKGSNNVHLYRKEGASKVFKVDFNCK